LLATADQYPGVRPTGHPDLRTFIEAGSRELDRLRTEGQNRAGCRRPGSSPRYRLVRRSSWRAAYTDHLAEVGLHPEEPVFIAK
jgi:hypothetical protein